MYGKSVLGTIPYCLCSFVTVSPRRGLFVLFQFSYSVIMASLTTLPVILEPSFNEESVVNLLRKYPLPADERMFAYGTAGFRQAADSDLEAVVVRIGFAAALRSMRQKGQAIGVMITASHNDESYNGVKVADPHGGMLGPDGEQMAVFLANERNIQVAWQYIAQELQLQTASSSSMVPVVHVGRDTRVHSPKYRDLLVRSITTIGGYVIDHGVCTTPMLHHVVLHDNFVAHLPSAIPCRPNVGGYLDLMAYSYAALCSTSQADKCQCTPALVVDCACGVGFIAMLALCQCLNKVGIPGKKIIPRNEPGVGPLNDHCGSEFVQKEQCLPQWYDHSLFTTQYCAALDGDADRVVFFSQDSSGKFRLLDGDKIACLFCHFIQEQLANLEAFMSDACSIRLGVVQTAYANGASTIILKKLLDPENVLIAKTGVKHVHHSARVFDIGVYFEANGHGTILFGPQFYKAIALLEPLVHGNSLASISLRRLQLLPALVNQAVGDALSDLLLVDAILMLQGWSIDEWDDMYQDLPSRQSKVMVPNRTLIQTNQNETKCTKPAGLQQDLEKVMKMMGGRAFVRPSGTEDVVRIYAEGPTREVADGLAQKAEQIVRRFTLPSKM